VARLVLRLLTRRAERPAGHPQQDLGVATTIGLAGRDQAGELAALHLDAALAGYADIFPTDAPPPTLDELTEQWRSSLGPSAQGRVRRGDAVGAGAQRAGAVLVRAARLGVHG
jgi:hypothetical protein